MQNLLTEDNSIDIPEGWILTPLCEAGKVVTGNTPSTSNPSYYSSNYLPWVTPPDLDYGIRISSAKKFLSKEGAEVARVLPRGSVMVSCIGNLGKVGIADVDVATNQQINSIIFNSDIDPEYGFYYCQTLNKWLESNSSSTTIAIVNKGRFEQAPFLKPDLSIQKHIVKKLSSYLPQVQESCDSLTKAKKLLQKFRQSVLSAAVTGKLTEEWREKEYKVVDINGLPEKWELVKLEDLNPEFQNGLAKRSGTTGDEVIVLRLADFSGFVMKKNNFRKIRLSSKEVDKYKLKKHDILIIRVNGSPQIAGKFFVFNEESLFAYCDHFIRLRVAAERISPYYLELVSGSTEARRYITDNLVSSAGQNTINQTTLKNIEILLPPLDEQEEIIRRTKSMFEIADLVEKQIEKARNKADKLTQSILSKAFRGEL